MYNTTQNHIHLPPPSSWWYHYFVTKTMRKSATQSSKAFSINFLLMAWQVFVVCVLSLPVNDFSCSCCCFISPCSCYTVGLIGPVSTFSVAISRDVVFVPTVVVSAYLFIYYLLLLLTCHGWILGKKSCVPELYCGCNDINKKLLVLTLKYTGIVLCSTS